MIRQALSVECLPKGEYGEDCLFFRVGTKTSVQRPELLEVTKIEVRDDVPGLHCNLWRVVILVGDNIIAEMPYTSVESITYKTGDYNEMES